MKILKYIIFSLVLTLSLSGGEVIETLPTRERAEMNIEVTKVFSEKLDALLDESNKEITLNFKETTIDESQFEVFLIENLNTLPSYSVSKGGRRALEVIKNGAKLRAGSKITTGKLSYFLDRAKGKKALKIQYEEKPEKLYLGVLNKSTNTVAKVFSINYDTPTTYAEVNISLTDEFKNEMIFTDDKIFDNIDPIVSKEGSGSVTATLDKFLTGNQTGDKRQQFRLSAIIGGSSRYTESGNTILHDHGGTEKIYNYEQPQIYIQGETNTLGPFPIKLELTSNNNPSYTIEEAIIAYRVTTKDKALVVQFKPSISSEIIKAVRNIPSRNIFLVWPENQLNQIAFPKSSWTTDFYGDINSNWITTIPSQYLIDNKSQETIHTAPYPSLKIVKTTTTYNGIIRFSNMTEYTETFDPDNPNDSDNLIENLSKGLNSDGSIKIFGTSEDALATLNYKIGDAPQELIFEVTNGYGNQMRLKIIYENNKLTYRLVDVGPILDDTNEIIRTFNLRIEHYEESGLLRKTTNMKIVTPKIGEKISSGILDFGVLLKGSNIDYPAETSIVVQSFIGDDLILDLESSNVSLTNGNSTVEATELSVDSGVVDGTNKVFKLSGVITKDNLNKSTAEGSHTGTVRLQMKVVPATTVNLNNK